MTTMPAPYDTDPCSTYRANDDMERHTLPRPARPTANRRPHGLVVDATGLWTGGLATAAVAALVGLVGTTQTVHSFDPAGAGMLCLLAAVAALAATGMAHLLLVSTPEPSSTSVGLSGWRPRPCCRCWAGCRWLPPLRPPS
jgi:hypothetical protein